MDTPLSLSELDKKISFLETKEQLHHQLVNNLALFQERMPKLYSKFKDYAPVRYLLQLTDDGYLNLMDTKTGVPLYPEDPKSYCKKQLNEFLNQKKIRFNSPEMEEGRFFEMLVENRISSRAYYHGEQKVSDTYLFGTFLLSGLGIGYLLPMLLKKIEINYFILFESNLDFFYASLQTIDWSELIQAFEVEHKNFILWVDIPFNQLPEQLYLYNKILGKHVFKQIEWFNHIDSEEYPFDDLMLEHIRMGMSVDGFIEDEQISLAHTVDSLNKNYPVLCRNDECKPPSSLPAIVVGNGPSLDGLVDLLKQHQNDVVIFSCGSSTGTLYRLGIKPDFHVEMERGELTSEVILEGTTEEFREGIRLLTLNTVTPKTHALFKESYIANKPNDAGAVILESEMSADVVPLAACNPTCTNFGLAIALELGFKDVYLFGVDLGTKEGGLHHASSSWYFDEDESKRPDNLDETQYEVEANFGGKAKTGRFLSMAKIFMEFSIKRHKEEQVYNPNDGVLIEGARPLKKEHIIIAKNTDKQAQILALLEGRFVKPKLTKALTADYVKDTYLSAFLNNVKDYKLPKKISTHKGIVKASYQLWEKVNKLEDQSLASYILLKGSVQSFLSAIYLSCESTHDKASLQKAYQFAREAYHCHLDFSVDYLQNKVLCLDEGNFCYSQADVDTFWIKK